MGEVGVHLDHQLGTTGQRALESSQVRVPKPSFSGPMQDLDGRELEAAQMQTQLQAKGRVSRDHLPCTVTVGRPSKVSARRLMSYL